MVTNMPQIAFLGLAERAMQIQEGPFHKWNIIGLKQVLPVFFVPLPLTGYKWIFAVRAATGETVRLRVTSRNDIELGTIEIGVRAVELGDAHDTSSELSSAGHTQLALEEAWILVCFEHPEPIVVPETSQYLIKQVQNDRPEIIVGSFAVHPVEATPMTPERVAALRADPLASKAVRLEIGCKTCPTKLRAWAGIDRSKEQDGYTWYQDLPDAFVCSCGANKLDVTLIKRNLHGLLGQERDVSSPGNVRLTPLYEEGAIRELLTSFLNLLVRHPAEEVIQKFMETNPILLHQFPAEKIFFKPAILTFFKADFAVLTPQKELIFIEIENTKTRLMTRHGDEAAPLSHAIGQVRNWLHTTDEHRAAALECLGIDRVSAIRGAVIAGRNSGYDPEHLRRLKGQDRGRISFFTFDDIAASLGSLAGRVGKL